MNQKVWVINDQDWHRSTKPEPMVEPPAAAPPLAGPPPQPQSVPIPPQKNPALAFSLSLPLAGGGLCYLGEKRPGAYCMAGMAFFCALLATLLLYRGALVHLLARHDLQAWPFTLAAGIFFLAGLLFWQGAAVAAYYRALRQRSEPFLGGGRALWPLLGSLLLPGWGQFLNGQPRKGLCFLPCGLLAFLSLFVLGVTRGLWPLLRSEPGRRLVELYLTAALLLLPLFLLLWLVGAYDAFRSCQRQQRKKMCLNNPGYRPGGRKVLRALVPRGSAVLGLLLAISLGMQFIPKTYYRQSLQRARLEMLHNRVEILPGLVQELLGFLGR